MITLNMKRGTLAMLLGSALLPGMALADPQSDFQTRYQQLQTALDTREPEQIKPLLTPDFSATDVGGRKQDADAMIDRLAMIPVDPDRAEKTTVQSVDLQGDTATVTRQIAASGSREGPDGQEHTMSFVSVSQDAWVKSGSNWLLKATEVQDMTVSRDGQVVRHMKKGDPMPPGGFRGRRGGPGGAGGPGPDGKGPHPGGPDGPPPPGDD